MRVKTVPRTSKIQYKTNNLKQLSRVKPMTTKTKGITAKLKK